MTSKSSRTWELTLNNYNAADEEMFTSWSPEVSRMVIAREVGEQGTPHLQGQITFKRTYRLSALKKLHPRVHWEPTKATQDNLYCRKLDADYVVDVDNRKQGDRTDLPSLHAMVDKGSTKLELFQENFGTMCRYYKGIYEYRNLVNARKSRPKPHVVWYYGDSGAGKSTAVDALAPDAYWLTPEHGDKLWWDGYDGQEDVILDDFRPNMIHYGALLKLLNNVGKYRIPTKGGSDWLFAKRFLITSDVHPKYMYNCYDEQLERRVDEFKEFHRIRPTTKNNIYQNKVCHHDLDFHRIPPKDNVEKPRELSREDGEGAAGPRRSPRNV